MNCVSQAEHARIIALGGKLVNMDKSVRINGVLAVSRAFGDMFLYPAVRPDPDMSTATLSGQEVRTPHSARAHTGAAP